MISDQQPEDVVREPGGARLETWKQIAGFFDREVRTVQRWEKTLGLPVHRYRNAKQDSVYAFVDELAAWHASRKHIAQPLMAGSTVADDPEVLTVSISVPVTAAPPAKIVVAPERKRNRRVVLLVAYAAAALIATFLIRRYGGQRSQKPNDLAATTFSALAGAQYSPTFSPDGRQVAFTWNGSSENNFDLYIKEVGSFSERRLTTDQAIDYSPAWSPNGKAIAFCRGSQTSKSMLLVLPLEAGGTERKILDVTSAVEPAARIVSWSADSRSVVLADQQGRAEHSLYLVDVTTHQAKRLTFPSVTQYDFDPSFAPSGDKIAFIRENGEGHFELHVLEMLQGRALKDRTLPLGGFESARIYAPAWTPDSAHILFVANHNGETGFWLVSADSPGSPEFVPVGLDVMQPAISQRGQLLYVHRGRRVGLWRLPLSHAATPTQIIGGQRTQDSPQISPRGNKLAFASNRVGSLNIWVSNTDGSSIAPLTFFKGMPAGSPSWSSDGSQLAFDTRSGDGTAIYKIFANGGTPQRLGTSKNFEGVPFWAPEGGWIYFSSDRSGRVEVWKMRSDGTGAEQVTKSGGFAGKPSPDGKRLYYLRQRGTSALWQMNLQTGEERGICPMVFDRAFAPTETGVMYVPAAGKDAFRVLEYDSQSGSSTAIQTLNTHLYLGITFSPREHAIYYAQREPDADQMLLIQDFWQ